MTMLCRDAMATAPSKAADTMRAVFMPPLPRVVLFGGLDSSTSDRRY